MKDISFILTGRDDGYTEDFIIRFSIALKKNIEIFSRHKLNWEIIVVDYNPIDNKFLKDHKLLKDLLQHKRVVNIIVDHSVLIDDGLPEEGFYEYFAKNCAAQNSTGKLLFMSNADIIISNDTVLYIENILNDENNKEFFYRWQYRQDVLTSGFMYGDILNLYNPNDPDADICGGYAGDATLFHRDIFIDIATGYNEMDKEHRTQYGQACMDGEILWNLKKKGINTKIVDIIYYHVAHQKQPRTKDNRYSKDEYTNKQGWGYSNYPVRTINSNTIEIYK